MLAARIASPTTVSHQLTALAVGTWYFVVTAYDTTGNESLLSNVASKVIP